VDEFDAASISCRVTLELVESSCPRRSTKDTYADKHNTKMIIGTSSCGGSTECIVEEKEQLAELKHRLDNVVTDLCELRVQVQKLKMDYFVIVAVCVGVALGCLMSKLWK